MLKVVTDGIDVFGHLDAFLEFALRRDRRRLRVDRCDSKNEQQRERKTRLSPTQIDVRSPLTIAR